MKTRAMRRVTARYTWDRLRVSFWFAPAVMAGVGVLLAWTMYSLDALIPNVLLSNSRFILSGTVGELRASLIAIATTVLTTAGVVFTLLTLPLSTVASQYGSRLLRVFLADRTTQIVLGMFVGTFVYCIAAALSILPVAVEPEPPQLTATIGLFLMIATFATLILLVQHISTMLQAPNIAAAAGSQLLEVVRTDSPDTVGSDDSHSLPASDARPAMIEAEGFPIYLNDTGYVQAVDPEILVTLAQERDLVIRLVCRPGAFVKPGAVVALVWPANRIDGKIARQVTRSFRLGNQRTPTQDVECAVNQLVEMAVRAMSPAINDPFTAMTCLDHMANGLVSFVQQGGENAKTYDDGGHLRLEFQPVTFDELIGAAFDMLRHASCDNASVLLHMLNTINVVGMETKSVGARETLLHHVHLIQSESQSGALIPEDRQHIERCAEELVAALRFAQ